VPACRVGAYAINIRKQTSRFAPLLSACLERRSLMQNYRMWLYVQNK